MAPVDLLTCSFMHCPSPSSSVDTLTNTRLTNNQVSFGHTECQGADESFHNLTSVTSVSCQHRAHQVMSSNHGEHVIIATKPDYDTDKSYGLTLARIPHARDRLGDILNINKDALFLSSLNIYFLISSSCAVKPKSLSSFYLNN